MLRRALCLLASYLPLGGMVGAEPAIRTLAPTTKVAQLTGDWDRERGEPTLSRTEERAGVVATDLGGSFVHKGRLVFLFGDTWGRPGDRDSIAFASNASPRELKLEFVTAPDGKFLPLDPGIENTGGFCVPSNGISLGDSMYVAYTGPVAGMIMSRSTLIRSDDDGRSWTPLYPISADDPATPEFEARFVNVAFARDEGDTIWMWGAGRYRASDLYLARTTAGDFESRDSWRYFLGLDDDGSPYWCSEEAQAWPLFEHPQFGEFSCAYLRQLDRWILLYNSAEPRGILLRSAPRPWGPWSEPIVLFDPHADGGYDAFMHIPPAHGGTDRLADPKRESEWGGEYGPYLIPSLTTGNAERCEIYYTMSTWNPYQVVLMRSTVGIGNDAATAEATR